MKTEKLPTTILAEIMLGNGSGVYVGRFSHNGVDDYALEIFKQVESEKQTETIINEKQKVQVTKIRPKGMDSLSPDVIDKRAKAIQKFLKDVSVDDALEMKGTGKNKKTLIDTELKFECEKFLIEEIQLIETPLIKTEMEIELKRIKTFNFLIRIKRKEIREICQIFINNL